MCAQANSTQSGAEVGGTGWDRTAICKPGTVAMLRTVRGQPGWLEF